MKTKHFLIGFLIFLLAFIISSLYYLFYPRYMLSVDSTQPAGRALHIKRAVIKKPAFIVLLRDGGRGRYRVGVSSLLPSGLYKDINVQYADENSVEPGDEIYVTLFEDKGNIDPDIFEPFDYAGGTEVDKPILGLDGKIYKKTVLIE